MPTRGFPGKCVGSLQIFHSEHVDRAQDQHGRGKQGKLREQVLALILQERVE